MTLDMEFEFRFVHISEMKNKHLKCVYDFYFTTLAVKKLLKNSFKGC